MKKNIYKLIFVVCGLLIVGFFIRLGVDYIYYDPINNSAPFYTLIIERVVEFIIPSIIVLIVGKLAKTKYKLVDPDLVNFFVKSYK